MTNDLNVTEAKIRAGLDRLLLSHSVSKSPEAKLLIAVITQAISDCKNDAIGPAGKKDAKDFLSGPRLDSISDLLGIEGEYIRQLCKRGGYI